MLQPILDVFILLARNLPVAFALFFGGWLLLCARGRAARLPRVGPAPVWFLSLGLLGIFAGVAAWYVTLEGFAGEVEPLVTTLSWMVGHGQPLYTGFSDAERYSVLYGPSVFLTNGLFLKVLGPSLPAVKLASALAAVGSLALLYGSLARRGRDTLAVALCAVTALYFWVQGFSIYAVRPDALMVFAVALGLYAAVRTRRWLAVATVAATAGFAVNLKLHGLLYFVPVLALLWQRCGRRAVLAAVGGTLAVAAMPFAFDAQISLVNYLAWVRNAMGHGLSTEFLWLDLGYAVALALPLALVVAFTGWRRWRGTAEGALMRSLLVVFPALLVLASKPGAGMVHLLPVAVPAVYVLGLVLRRLQAEGFDWRPRVRQSAAAAFALMLLLSGSVNQYRAVRLLDWQVGRTPDVARDVRGVMARYPDLPMAMACGGEDANFLSTWPRPLLAFRDNPVLLDPIAVMESSASGRELAPSTYDAITDGRIPLWLVPRGQEPFRKVNWYAPHRPIFPDDFVKHFEECYSPRAQTRYFDLWFWNGLAGVAEAAGKVSPGHDGDGRGAATPGAGTRLLGTVVAH